MKKTFLFVLLLGTYVIMQAQSWTQLGSDIDGETAGDWSGYSVSLNSDGSVVAIGEPENDGNGDGAGQVRVYQNNNGTWSQIGADINGEAIGDNFGSSVSLSADGSILAVGAPDNDGNGSDAGHVRIFENNGGTWSQLGQDIDGEDGGDGFGTSVSLSADGNIVAIGAPYNDDNASTSGHVRVYQYNSSTGQWEQIGQDIDGENSGDVSGTSVALNDDGTVVVIGAPNNDENGSKSGQVRVFEYNSSNSLWEQKGQSLYGENQYYDAGKSVSINSDGTVIAMGIPRNDDHLTEAGEVKIYSYNSSTGQWEQMGQNIYGESSFDNAGYSVSLSSDGTTIAIGSYLSDANGNTSGQARVFKYIDNVWVKVGQNLNGEAEYDEFGYSISLSSDGSVVAVGGRQNDGIGEDAGHVRIFSYGQTSIDEVENAGVLIYPNPSNGVFSIENAENYEITISDISGRIVFNAKNVNKTNVELLKSGVYLINFKSETRSLSSKIIIK